MTVPPRQSDDVRIPEDVIERAARGWDPDFESYTSMLRAEALEDASRALVASGLPARVAELEELCDQLAFVVNSYDEASSDVYKAELRAEVIEAARLLAAALNAKGAE